ncbi:MAG: protease SohB [Pseudomonadales bacterium]|nr:protease SohB [Pseudomonadales bacterium]
MEYLYEYLGFLAKSVTLVIAVLVVISSIVASGMRKQTNPEGFLEIVALNKRHEDMKEQLTEAFLSPDELKKQHKSEEKVKKKEKKQEQKQKKRQEDKDLSTSTRGLPSATGRKRLFVLEFNGDLQASRVDALRHEVTAVLTGIREQDSVLVCIDSAGGMVHTYGLAASQLERFKQKGVNLTAAIDKVAASGGYLMATTADQIIAAPFALVGSIGVVAQIPNVHRLLKKYDVDVDILTAGKYKRTLTTLGENTDEGRAKFIEELNDVHQLFQEFVSGNRPVLDIEEVSTGEAWYGSRALDKKLVDKLMTSDEFVMEACEDSDVYHLKWVEPKKPLDRIMAQFTQLFNKVGEQIFNQISGSAK